MAKNLRHAEGGRSRKEEEERRERCQYQAENQQLKTQNEKIKAENEQLNLFNYLYYHEHNAILCEVMAVENVILALTLSHVELTVSVLLFDCVTCFVIVFNLFFILGLLVTKLHHHRHLRHHHHRRK
jgi:hypothetical protein